MSTIRCCLHCTDKRHPGCHSTCEIYKQEKELNEKSNKWLSEMAKSTGNINEFEFERVSKKRLNVRKK